MPFDPVGKAARLGLRPKSRPHCPVQCLQCPLCPTCFVVPIKIRRKYCSELCAAKALMARPSSRYSLEGALSRIRAERTTRNLRRSVRRQAKPLPPLPHTSRNPVLVSHVPGSIAFALLYGQGSFCLNSGPNRAGHRANAGRAIQVGGPNV